MRMQHSKVLYRVEEWGFSATLYIVSGSDIVSEEAEGILVAVACHNSC